MLESLADSSSLVLPDANSSRLDAQAPVTRCLFGTSSPFGGFEYSGACSQKTWHCKSPEIPPRHSAVKVDVVCGAGLTKQTVESGGSSHYIQQKIQNQKCRAVSGNNGDSRRPADGARRRRRRRGRGASDRCRLGGCFRARPTAGLQRRARRRQARAAPDDQALEHRGAAQVHQASARLVQGVDQRAQSAARRPRVLCHHGVRGRARFRA